MSTEQLYIFVDKSGHCFEDFQDKDDGSGYNNLLGAWLRGRKMFTVGDMLVFKQELIEAGFHWGKDFYIKKF